MTVFVIQETTMEDDFTFACLIANSYKDIIFLKYLPFVNTYVFKNTQDVDLLLKADKIVCNSGINMLLDVAVYHQITCMIGEKNQLLDSYTTSLVKNKLKSGYFYDPDQFDFFHLSMIPLLKPCFLNKSFKFLPYKQAINHSSFSVPTFVKPSSDLKWFNAGVVKTGTTFKQFIDSQMHSNVLNNPYFDCTVLFAKPIDNIKMMYEYRSFIINGKFITGSIYGMNRKQIPIPTTEHLIYFQKWAQSFANIISNPGVNRTVNTYVMDLILTDGFDLPPSIVELNCLNCSGMYMSDNMKLVEVLRDME